MGDMHVIFHPAAPAEYEKERILNMGTRIKMTLESRVPSKWRFVDLETGDIWMWVDGTFKRAPESTYGK